MAHTLRAWSVLPAAVLALGLAAPVAAQPDERGSSDRARINQVQLSQGTTIEHADPIPLPQAVDTFDPDGPLPPAFAPLPAPTPGNASFVVQNGSRNASVLVAGGRGNRTAQFQNGSDNRSVVDIDGDDNRALTDQNGRHHEAELLIRGNSSAIATIQNGIGKRIRVEQRGPMPAGIVIRQN